MKKKIRIMTKRVESIIKFDFNSRRKSFMAEIYIFLKKFSKKFLTIFLDSDIVGVFMSISFYSKKI